MIATTAIAGMAAVAAGLTAQAQQTGFHTYRTTNGCLFRETYPPEPGDRWTWSGACTQGQYISGQGVLRREQPPLVGDGNVAFASTWTGRLVNGYKNGEGVSARFARYPGEGWKEDSFSFDRHIPTLATAHNMGCAMLSGRMADPNCTPGSAPAATQAQTTPRPSPQAQSSLRSGWNVGVPSHIGCRYHFYVEPRFAEGGSTTWGVRGGTCGADGFLQGNVVVFRAEGPSDYCGPAETREVHFSGTMRSGVFVGRGRQATFCRSADGRLAADEIRPTDWDFDGGCRKTTASGTGIVMTSYSACASERPASIGATAQTGTSLGTAATSSSAAPQAGPQPAAPTASSTRPGALSAAQIDNCDRIIKAEQVASQSWPGDVRTVSARLGRFQYDLFTGQCAGHPQATQYLSGARTMLAQGGVTAPAAAPNATASIPQPSSPTSTQTNSRSPASQPPTAGLLESDTYQAGPLARAGDKNYLTPDGEPCVTSQRLPPETRSNQTAYKIEFTNICDLTIRVRARIIPAGPFLPGFDGVQGSGISKGSRENPAKLTLTCLNDATPTNNCTGFSSWWLL